METFARRPDKEREDILREAATRRGIREIIIEKDFWVCWTLGRLYAVPELAEHITFKGGTSLSKAYGLIERFSEDIDLTIGRTAPYIRDTKSPMEDEISRKERERRLGAVREAAQRFVLDSAQPLLHRAFAESLDTTEGWEIVPDPEDPDGQTLLFHYPRVMNYGMGFGMGGYGVGRFGEGEFGYIKPSVKLEFGARGGIEPHAMKAITPYVAEDFPDFFEHSTIQAATLAAERTFWEKATILHALHHGSKLRDRMSRHYYDTYVMAEKGTADSALQMPELLDQVVQNKSLLFRDNKASYDTAKIGSVKLVPSEDLLPALRKDYEAMQEMFMEDAPDFDTVMQRLGQLEEQINRGN